MNSISLFIAKTRLKNEINSLFQPSEYLCGLLQAQKLSSRVFLVH